MKYILAGLLGGILGGMGMGGGTVLVPLLTLWLAVDQREAQWLNVAAFIPMSVIAIIIHAKNGLIERKPLICVLIGALPFSIASAFLAYSVPSEKLGKAFGVFLVMLGAFQIVQTLKKPKTYIPRIPFDE
ncbi:MAG: sulfite exporter TauE/SafE family protein [Clostridia bacterium]|nr:sulfite exporter TauE/SafE family protein [Clostridia bacterium]